MEAIRRTKGAWLFVVVAALVLLAGASFATVSFSQQASVFTSRGTAASGACPYDMVEVNAAGYSYCIDRYEASPGRDCPVDEPNSAGESTENIDAADCVPVAVEGKTPWTYVAQHQAQSLCARAGKRLPTAMEWYTASLGMPGSEASCNLNEGSVTTGAHKDCRSGAGVYDLVGNVWEWVDARVEDGQYEGKSLTPSGYVHEVGVDGVPTQTDTEPSSAYGSDYFWNKASGTYPLMRGGFYGSESDGGLYAVHAATEQSRTGTAIGFRCATSL